MSYLVIGNAINETVIRTEDGAKRRHTGGVGAIMARELALNGQEVTFLTTAPTGTAAREMEKDLAKGRLRPVIVPGNPAQRVDGKVQVQVTKGEPVTFFGHRPRMTGLAEEIRQLAPLHEWTLIALTLTDQDLAAVSSLANNLAVNATAKQLVHRIKKVPRLAALTMNRNEYALLAKTGISHAAPEDLPMKFKGATVMITRGARGRSVYAPATPPNHRPAPELAAGTDYIGTGDAATAGLVHAMNAGEDHGELIDAYIRNLGSRNAQGYAA